MMLRHWFVFGCAFLLVSTARAQFDGFDDIGVSRQEAVPGGGRGGNANAPSSSGGLSDLFMEGVRDLATNQTTAATGAVQVHGASIAFELGRHNLGFPNLNGAMRLGGIAGNCYAMAYVTKLFFERASYVPTRTPPERGRGFTLEGVAAALSGGRGAKFSVLDFPSLHDMSYEKGFAEREAFTYLERDAGLATSGSPSSTLAGRKAMVVRLMQLITTVHYLHYINYQGGRYLEAVLERATANTKNVFALNTREIQSMKSQLDRGELALLVMLGTRQVFGHVVLAYRIESNAQYDNIYLYDSNVQYADEKHPSVLRIDKKGEVVGYFKKSDSGSLAPDSIYDSEGWFTDKASLAILNAADPSWTADNLKTLAAKARDAAYNTAYLMAAGRMLSGLTTVAPETRSMKADILEFVRNAQVIDKAYGRSSDEPLSKNADARTLNTYFASNSDRVVKMLFPNYLPRGLSLADTSIALSESDDNKASLKTTLVVEKDSEIYRVVRVLQESAMISNAKLGEWIEAASENVGPTKIRATIEFDVVKTKLADGAKTPYGPAPHIKRSHVVLGDLEPSAEGTSPHQIEISKETIAGAVNIGLKKLGVIDFRYEHEYVLVPATDMDVFGRKFQVLPEVRRKGYVQVREVRTTLAAPSTDLPNGAFVLEGDLDGFLACNPFVDGRGVSVTTRPLALSITLHRPSDLPVSKWTFEAGLDGTLAFDDGLKNLATRAVLAFAKKRTEGFKDGANATIRDRLNPWIQLEKPLEISRVDLSLKKLTARSTTAQIDAEQLARKIFAFTVPMVIDQLRLKSDRAILDISERK